MNELTQTQLLERVTLANRPNGNPRVQKITARIVGDLFRAIDELDIQPDEFWAGVDWLSRLASSGQAGLITAGLGFDRLLDIRLDEADERAGRNAGTPRAIEGPLYIAGAPLSKYETRVDEEGDEQRGETMVMEGRVLDVNGKPVAGAIVDVWHANELGRYSHFDPDQAEYALRRKIETDAQGRYRFRSFLPPGYAIPPNSPTSELFSAIGRHGNRPAHIHFLVVAPGLRTLTTQVNVPGDSFIDDDFAFATRDGLILKLERNTPPKGYESLGVTTQFTRVPFDFVMQPAVDESEADPQARVARALA
ncbi:dioxygenase [Variovorax sp. J22R133]|uniref:dioxygenase family protein n=1 Tax=Variovorax brevis TaxID=3053503 RepID=UPI0025787265|nr:dioxygenase [Variovorax sp. J22R133]MDM0115196.1 dioxygenase [Variovorax sp. J22R133]